MKKVFRFDLVGWTNAHHFNHGCRNYAVAEIVAVGVNDDAGKVSYLARIVEAQSCHSCWQVGHDENYVFEEVGDLLKISPDELIPAGEEWSKEVSWEWTGSHSGDRLPSAKD